MNVKLVAKRSIDAYRFFRIDGEVIEYLSHRKQKDDGRGDYGDCNSTANST